MINVGDWIKAYPMMIGGEVVKKYGATKSGTVISVLEPGISGNLRSKYKGYIIEKHGGEREIISERQLADEDEVMDLGMKPCVWWDCDGLVDSDGYCVLCDRGQ